MLRPSLSPQSGFGRVSGNGDWYLPARAVLRHKAGRERNREGDGLSSASSVSSKTHQQTIRGHC